MKSVIKTISIITIALILMFALALAACGGGSGGSSDTQPSSQGGDEQNGATPEESSSDDSNASNEVTDNPPSGETWPTNEWTQQVPKPPFTVETSGQIGTDFNISFSDTNYDTVKAYVEELQANGFVAGTSVTDTGDEILWYGENPEGWVVSISDDGYMIITKPE